MAITSKRHSQVVPAGSDALRALVAIAPLDETEPIFRHRDVAATSRQLQRQVRTLLEHAGIRPPKAGAHTFRHTFATRFLERGGSPKDLQLILGHSSLAVTEKYLHLVVNDRLIDDHRRFSPLSDVLAAGQLRLAFSNDEEESHG